MVVAVTVACIIQARLGSTRLPAKVMLELPTGRTVLQEVVHRCWQIPGIDVVVVATPDADGDIIRRSLYNAFWDDDRSKLEKMPEIVRGPEHDVLARYAKAAEAVNADVIMRITADCPLIDPEVCGDVLKLQQSTGADYVSNAWPSRSFPQGFDCEVFTRRALDRAHAECDALNGKDHFREHAGCPWMQAAPGLKRAHLKAKEDRSQIRWTLDTQEKGPDGMGDFTRIWSVMEQQMREAA